MNIKKLFLSGILTTAMSMTMVIRQEVKAESKKEYLVTSEKSNIEKALKSEGIDSGKIDAVSDNSATVTLSNSEVNGLKDNHLIVESNDFVTGSTINKDEIKPKDDEWNTKIINAHNKDNSVKKSEIKVAVLDSGLNGIMQEDLQFEKTKDFIGDERNWLMEDSTGHGTAISSILIGNNEHVKGINKNIKLYSGRILDSELSAPISRVIEAINWAIEEKVDIISISFGTRKYSKALEIAINEAINQGIVVIAASGNSSSDSSDYPAKFDNVISVGSINSKADVSEFSNTADVYAPGEAVLTNGDLGSTIAATGTSISVPHVVGITSLLLEENPNLTPKDIKKLLINSSNNKIVDFEMALNNINNVDDNINNHNSIETFDNTEMESKVIGSWSKTNHIGFATAYASYIPAMYLNAFNDGAKAPDESGIGVSGMDANPQFHGYFHDVKNGYRDVNILAAYRLLIKVANEYEKGKDYKTAISNSNATAAVSNLSTMKRGLEKYNSYMAKKGYDTAAKKRAFAFGVALHTATDYLAHSTYEKTSSGWKRIMHPDADSTSKIKERYQYAQRIGRNVVYRYANKRKDVAVSHDFHMSDSASYYNNVNSKNIFRIANIRYYYYKLNEALGAKGDDNVRKHYIQMNITIDKNSVKRVD